MTRVAKLFCQLLKEGKKQFYLGSDGCHRIIVKIDQDKRVT